MREANTLVLASNNKNKYVEFCNLFKFYPHIKVERASKYLRNTSKLGLVETHDTYVENALAKARLVNGGCHYPALGDDSGIEVMHLEGKPGVRSHRFAIAKAGQSQDLANVEKLLSELKGVPKAKRKARFVAHLALVMEGISVTAEGVLEGSIAESPQGENGFGYDPIFIPDGYNKTLAVMTEEEKNAISHRSKALHELMTLVKNRGLVFAKP